MTFKLTKKGRIGMLVSTRATLDDTNGNSYDMVTMNSINTEITRTGIMAAEEKHSPIIIQLGPGQMKNHVHMEETIPVMKELTGRVHVPVAMNLDHGADFYIITDYINVGFTSVMFGGSSLPCEENVKQTAIISTLARGIGCSAEGELSHVGRTADADDTDLDLYANPDQALDFVKRTGVNALVVAIDAAHGTYPKRKIPRLDFEGLHQLKEALKMSLILRGGSGSDEENLRKAMAGSTNKVNVCTDTFEAGKAVTLKLLEENPGADYLHMCMAAEAGIKKFVKDYMRVVSPNGCYIYGEEVAAGNE